MASPCRWVKPMLFLSDPQPELLEDRPEHVYGAVENPGHELHFLPRRGLVSALCGDHPAWPDGRGVVPPGS